MSSKWPPVKNQAYVFRCVLFAQSDNQIKANPTIASGDWKVSIDGGAFANLATLPDVDPDGSVQVKVSLSADEMNGDEIMVTAIDAAGAEWHSAAWVIHTVGQTFDAVDANVDAILEDTGSTLDFRLDVLDNISNQILADTAELQTDWANGGRLDVILDARASQTSVDDLPTNAELATALGTADDAVLAAVAVVNAQLATSAAAVASAVADGEDLTGYRGDTFTVNFSDLGNVTARTKLWFTAKRKASDADDDAMIQIEETGDLLYIAGAAAETAANGSLTVTDAATGDMTLALAAVETAKMPSDRTLVWDIQMLTAGGVSTLAAGTLAFTADVTRATS